MQCPSRFLKQPSPKPVVPIKMAIIGPPKSGKTGRKYRRQDGVFLYWAEIKFQFGFHVFSLLFVDTRRSREQNRLNREYQ